jgi:hypothetical protein
MESLEQRKSIWRKKLVWVIIEICEGGLNAVEVEIGKLVHDGAEAGR